MKAVFLDYDTVSNGDLDVAALSAAVEDLKLCDSDDAKTAERIRDVEVVLLNKVELSRELLRGARKLKLIAVAGTGTNNIDVAAARELAVAVCNVRGYCTSSVVQHVWGLILSLTQHVSDYARLARGGSWTRNEALTVLAHPIRELNGRIFGVVGWGELGRGAARVAEAFGMQVVIANRRGDSPRPARVELEQLLAMSDRRTRTLAHETRRALDQHGTRRVGGRPRPEQGPQSGSARRRGNRCPAPRAAARWRSVARSRYTESPRDAARGVGCARGATALPR
jgi:glycerate dehydrogenase